MKGQLPEQELAELVLDYQVIPINMPDIDAERCLIRLEWQNHG